MILLAIEFSRWYYSKFDTYKGVQKLFPFHIKHSKTLTNSPSPILNLEQEITFTEIPIHIIISVLWSRFPRSNDSLLFEKNTISKLRRIVIGNQDGTQVVGPVVPVRNRRGPRTDNVDNHDDVSNVYRRHTIRNYAHDARKRWVPNSPLSSVFFCLSFDYVLAGF